MEHDLKQTNLDEWIIVKATSGGFLGRVSNVVLSKVAATHEHNVDKFKEKILELVAEDKLLALKPCFDFMAPLRPVQTPDGKMAFQRDPVIVPFDFTLMEVPVFVKPVAVMFCADLQGQDKNTYKTFVEQALELALHGRAQQSGLTLAGRMPAMKGMAHG